MIKPVFFSVGGKPDAEFAKTVKKFLPDQLVYLYTAGAEGVPIRPEIEANIQGCRLFVVFWSNDYLASEHACRELAFFRKAVENDPSKDRALLIVPREAGGPDIQSKWTNPITQKSGEFVFGSWRSERALDIASDAAKIAEHVRRKLEKAKVISSVLIPRGHVVDSIKSALAQQDFKQREFIFVSGLEGHGRRTAIRQFMLASYPNKTERQVSFDSAEAAEDLLLRLMDSASMASSDRDQVLESIANGATTTTKEIRKIIHNGRTNNSYYIISVDRFSGIDALSLPHWVNDVFNIFADGNAPLVFLVTSNAVSAALLRHYPNAGRVSIAGLDEHEIEELTHKLSLEDPSPSRWTKEGKALVTQACGGSPSLCKTIMLSIAGEPTLDFLKEIASNAEVTFSAYMSGLLRHLVVRFKNSRHEILALRVIEKLGVVSKQALDDILEPMLKGGSYDLYQLREFGLVEQLADGVYRIPPLLQRRLGDALWGQSRDVDLNELFASFAKRILVMSDDYGAIYASNRVSSAIRTGTAVPEDLSRYMTLSTLFKAGLERYSNKEFVLSHGILSRAMARMRVSAVVDLTTQIEIARYFGLASARKPDSIGMNEACTYLNITLSHSRKASQARAMALFIRGFNDRLNRAWSDAAHNFHNALYELRESKGAERQRGAIYTELSATYLRMNPPKLHDALEMANNAFEQKDVTHTLNAYVHALILYVFRSGEYNSEKLIEPELKKINALLVRLTDRSKERTQEFHLDRQQEFEREHSRWAAVSASRNDGNYSPTICQDTPFEVADPEYP